MRFILTLFVSLIIFYVGYALFSASHYMQGMLRLVASVTSSCLDLLGYEVTTRSNVITTSGFTFQIVQGCEGLEPVGFLFAAALATPTTIPTRLLFCMYGAALLLVLNVGRIISVAIIGTHAPQFATVVHWNVWPALIVAFIVILWLMWARRVRLTDHGRT